MSLEVNGLSFNGAEQAKQKKSSGATYPLLGALAGGGIGYLAMKKQPTEDQFQKSLTEGREIKYTSDLTKEEQEAVDKAKKSAPAKTETKTETKTDAKTEAKTEAKPEVKTKGSTKSLATEKTAAEIFDKETELGASEYLDNKYDVKNTQDLMDRIADEKKELADAGHKKSIKNAQYKLDKAKEYGNRQISEMKMNNKIAQSKIEIEELKASIVGLDEKSTKVKNTNRKIESINKEIERTEAQKAKLKEVKVPAGVEAFESDTAAINKEIEKAEKTGGRIEQAIKDAKAKKLTELQDKAVADAKKEASAKKTTLTADDVKRIRDDVKADAKATAQIDAAGELAGRKKTLELKNSIIEKQIERHNANITKTAENGLAKEQKAFSRQSAKIAEMESDLGLVREAKKNGTKITKETAEGVISKGSAKIKEEMVKVGSKVAEESKTAFKTAYEAVKGKLAKTSSTKTGLIAAAVGLAVGLGIKMMSDGGSKTEA